MARQFSRNLYRRHVSTRTQGAFNLPLPSERAGVRILSILLALVALTHTSLAQLPGVIIPIDSGLRARGFEWAVLMKAKIGGVHFSPKGTYLVATADSTFLLEPMSARVVKAFQKYGYTSISSDEQYLLGFDYRDSSVVKVRIDDGKTVARHRFDSLSNWSSCTFTKDGNYCVVVQATPWKTTDPSPPSRLSWIFFNVNTGEVVHRKNFLREPGVISASIQDVAFDCSEERLFVGVAKYWSTGGRGTMCYYNKATGDSVTKVDLGADSPGGYFMQLSPTCKYMSVTDPSKFDTPDEGISVYNIATKERLAHFTMNVMGTREQFTPDEKYLVVSRKDNDGSIDIYDIQSGKLMYKNTPGTFNAVAIAPKSTHYCSYVVDELYMIQMPDFVTDVDERNPPTDILYPNPSTGVVEIKCTLPRAGVLTMTVSTSDGRIVRTIMQPGEEGENKFVLPTADLSSGGYRLRCTMGGGYSQTYSFIITK
ncbi:MAG: T9SS type A sorting domain-containing protein [Candidatus Kapabacteria bacterium]|nr:T9SS type A sorting domain-containing protein [Candidatus Kapabacteria bacterium]